MCDRGRSSHSLTGNQGVYVQQVVMGLFSVACGRLWTGAVEAPFSLALPTAKQMQDHQTLAKAGACWFLGPQGGSCSLSAEYAVPPEAHDLRCFVLCCSPLKDLYNQGLSYLWHLCCPPALLTITFNDKVIHTIKIIDVVCITAAFVVIMLFSFCALAFLFSLSISVFILQTPVFFCSASSSVSFRKLVQS